MSQQTYMRDTRAWTPCCEGRDSGPYQESPRFKVKGRREVKDRLKIARWKNTVDPESLPPRCFMKLIFVCQVSYTVYFMVINIFFSELIIQAF
ncbi:hypothetical protein E2C01_086622 [Portunus trituberculatus]|uniref:Uncharacterized protein n=1 Tax=Portunus trituberculatus TaxID=210409 RepID=A0A5B7JDZ2_PORTR|nr:hypothetical protein [Portunus trituberculatus]